QYIIATKEVNLVFWRVIRLYFLTCLERRGLRFHRMDKSRENGLFIVFFLGALQLALALTILSLKANTKRIFGGAK
ncbi:hypothetical protein, partial [Listeria booriae]|uniref:hypothetical protein n=1 Tax=Listeria booriae TaxID=1552123 RepID=UPI001C89EA40